MSVFCDVMTVGSLFVELTPSNPGTSLASARDYTLVAGGAAANTVFALARLGVQVRFVTAVGDDDFGALAITELANLGVDITNVQRVAGQLTPVAFSSIDRQGGKHFRFYRFPGCCAPLDALTQAAFHNIGCCRLFDFGEGSIRERALRELVFQAAREARSKGKLVLYAANLRRQAWQLPDQEIRVIERQAVGLADIVVMNEEEAVFISGLPGDEGMQMVQSLGPRVVVVTGGGEHDMRVRVGEETTRLAPVSVPVIYDVGAGDTFHAGLVAAALRNDPATMTLAAWREAVRFAAAVAAIRVSSSPDPQALPTYSEVESWMSSRV